MSEEYDYDNNLKIIIKNNDFDSFKSYIENNDFSKIINIMKTTYIPISPLYHILVYDRLDMFEYIINYPIIHYNKKINIYFNKTEIQNILNYIFYYSKNKIINYLISKINLNINNYNIEELIFNLIKSRDINRLNLFITKYNVKFTTDKFIYFSIERNIKWMTLFLLKNNITIRNYLIIINLLLKHNDYESLKVLFENYEEADNIIYVYHNKIKISDNEECNIILFNHGYDFNKNKSNFNRINNNCIVRGSDIYLLIKTKQYYLLQRIINEI